MQEPNIQPAKRLETIQEYYLQRKLAEVAAMKQRGENVISLGIGGPDMPPPPCAVETLCKVAHQSDTHSYQPGNGTLQMRREFSHWYKEHYSVDLDPDTEVMPLIGSKEGITHISMTFLNPGDGVLVPNPGYPTYTSVSNIAGAQIFTYPLLENAGWMPDFEYLETLPLDKIKLMWVNYPNMPTGAPATRQLFERLVDFGLRHNILICHDNPYSFILNEHPLSILEVPGARQVCIELNSLSKSHNMSGWRVGMLATNSKFISWIRKIKSNVDSGQFLPIMEAVAQALTVDKKWYDEINAMYASRRKWAEQLACILGCTFDPRQRGMFLWCRIPDNEPSGEALADRMLQQHRIFITPGFIFGSQGQRYIRISLCAKEHAFEQAIQRIENNTKQ